MHTEAQLLIKLEQQIAKVEKFIIDLQQENRWQQIFQKNKLYLNLSNIFKNNYIEYTKYLENIINDYNLLKKIKDDDIKIYYIHKIEYKIFALFKVLRNLKKYHTLSGSNLTDKIANKQIKVGKLSTERDSLEKMLAYINNQYNILNKQLMYGEAQPDLQQKLLNLLGKKGKLERDLFSVVERLRLLQ